eukprot:TRINITY_DN28687_c0_g1_i1.p1 TRINITY_DN28687_c0_g1~~TRINITY_DN28687_c0_g1_i1.p1  ORF type:complete len:157 (-),score=23.13 TRINITY_DN28687_c0_g1_i1:818-1288(-)
MDILQIKSWRLLQVFQSSSAWTGSINHRPRTQEGVTAASLWIFVAAVVAGMFLLVTTVISITTAATSVAAGAAEATTSLKQPHKTANDTSTPFTGLTNTVMQSLSMFWGELDFFISLPSSLPTTERLLPYRSALAADSLANEGLAALHCSELAIRT